MEYWQVQWVHDFKVEPDVIYSEVGHGGYEVRKVQHYRDGRTLRADALHDFAEIGLSEAPVGSIEDVARQPEFRAWAISRSDFEVVWSQASWPVAP